MMHLTADREGRITKENSMQDRFLEVLYHHMLTRMFLRPLVSPAVSRIGGWFLGSKVSRLLIPLFVRRHSIDMADYEQAGYASYNDFFKRKLAEGARSVETAEHVFVSPCDSRLSVYEINDRSVFSVKHTQYTVESLLKNRKLARAYCGGYIWIFRLCVEDYHHFIYVDAGSVSGTVRIPGVFHTVNPAALDRYPVYKENTREYSVLKSENFGNVLQMEVGAMLVGKIENHPVSAPVQRGQEKGNFAFGGSTVILMTQIGAVIPDEDILKNSALGIETRVRLGEPVGVKVWQCPL